MLPLLLTTAATGMLIGLSFTIQLVHYPLFARVGAAAWPAYAAEHATRIGIIVLPWMALEAASGAWLALHPPAGLSRPLIWAAAALVAGTWLLTLLLNGPLFSRLAAGWDPALHRTLVLANWPRTVLWVARGTLLLVLLAQAWRTRGGS
ncbi:MAG TPA: hypothetical protein VFX50_11075 [Gemmatimonadales bacterium]|nr:hypothetical protein [Gemmatimonadales bacterium]